MSVWKKARMKTEIVEFREVEPREQIGFAPSPRYEGEPERIVLKPGRSSFGRPIMGEVIESPDRRLRLPAIAGEDVLIRVAGEEILRIIGKNEFHEHYEVVE